MCLILHLREHMPQHGHQASGLRASSTPAFYSLVLMSALPFQSCSLIMLTTLMTAQASQA